MLFDEHKDNSEQTNPNNPYNIEGQGKQIGYEDYLQYKQDFNDSRTLSYSSSDLYKKRIRERDAALLDSAFWATTAVGAGTLLYHQANRSDSIRYLLQEAPLASLARHKLTKQFQDNKAAGLIAGAIDPRLGNSPQTVGASLHSMLLGLEELSPMQLMKTLQLSSFSSLFVEIVDAHHEQARHIKGSSIANYGDYYKNMIKKEAGVELSADDLNRGFILEKGKLYKALPGTTEGQVVRGDKLLDHARIVATGIKTGEDAISTNRVFEKLANGYGVNIKRHMINAEPLAIVGANSKEGLITNWIRAYGRFSVELGARSLDNPLGFIEEYINMSGGGSKIFNSKAYQTLKKYSNIQLGSGGVYNTTTRDMLTKTGKNLAVKGVALTVGLNLADVVVENIAPENSAWANGIISGLADTAMKAHIKFAEIWSDNFQAIKKAQEFAAPGSTELTSLLGLTLAGTMAGANAAYAHRMYDNTRLGVDEASAKHIQERRIGGKLGDILDKVGKNKPTTTLGRYSKVGALAGAALAVPFLPGALVGKSSDELRAEYSGEKEVAVKSTRYWLCMTADNPVFTREGYLRADEVEEGDILFDSEGNTSSIVSVHKRWTKERTFEIRSKLSLPLFTKITENHEVLTERGWVEAKDLTLEDKVVVGIPSIKGDILFEDLGEGYRFPLGVLENTINHVQTNRYTGELSVYNRVLSNRYLPMDKECGLFLGWFLAEGCVNKKKDSETLSAIEISFHESEKYFAEERVKFLKEALGLTIKGGISRNQGEGLRLRFGNEPFGQFLLRFFYRDGKKIFPNLTRYPLDFVRGFLKGMFYGDGGVSKVEGVRSRFYIKSATMQHLVEFRRYASVFGAYGSIQQDRGSGTYKLDFNENSSYALQQQGLYKELYKSETFEVAEGLTSFEFKSEYILLSLDSIEEFVYEGYVYDFTMSGKSEYTPSTFVIHNSGGGDYRGGKVEYHRDHLLRVLATDAETKTLYGDRETKRALNPILKPFAYLSNPYRFEEMHTHDAPMPVWGMDTSYGSFLGQIFRGTAGQIIKPTVVHPELEKQQNAILEGQATLSLRGNLTNLAKSVEKGLQKEIHNKKYKSSSSDLTTEKHYLPWLATEQEMTYGQGVHLDSETYTTPEQEKKDVKSLIEDGMMLRKNAPTNEPYFRSFQGAYSGAEEFVGLKGFASGLTVGLSGAHPVDQLRPELEISGSTTNASKAIQNLALGDAMGCFLPGTPVLTKKGSKPIEKITTKDKVLSLGYKFRRVKEVHTKEFKDIEILRVYIEGKSLPITCTPDHVFPSILTKDLEIVDREIRTLKEGDYLLRVDTDLIGKFKWRNFFPSFKVNKKNYFLKKIVRIEKTVYSGPVYDLSVNVTPYYTVCGVLCHNSGEFLRRLFPQSASARRETINPMRNLVTPEWMPSNDTKYYKNYSRGAVWSHNEMGEVLTPGTKGFETLNPELKNVDPNEIPLVYQYKVLQNIANKSPEHLAIKEHLVRNLDKLSQKEKDVFFEAYGQDEAKERLKEFNEYAEDGEKSRMGLFAVHNAIWETVAHTENPLEPLLPFRPMAKFVHQRTAIEDYEKTQMMGPDTGIWTNPVSHFIKPAANRVVKNAHGGFVPEEYEEKNRVDQYFDKLALIKADKNGNTYEKERNLTALAYTGVRNAEDMRKFKMALSTEQRAYVESFSREKDQEKRQKILQMVPNDIGRIYQSVWKNIDNYDIAVKKGLDPKAYLDEIYLKETGKMASITKVELSRKEKQEIKDKEYADKTFLEERKLKKLEEAKALRLKAATKEAYKYVEKQTGKVPGENWIGWDPRLTVDDIKLKTLLVGREDIHKYGYWGTDVERIERLVALDRENQITDDLDKIKRELRAQSQNQITLTNKLRNAGFEVSRINTSPASKSSLTIKETEEYLNDYYQK